MEIVQALVNGLLVGGVYAVVSIGLTLVFGVMSIVNFAQAEFLMLGMFVAFFCWQQFGLDPLVGALFAFVVVFAFGMLVQRVLVERVLRAPEVAQIFLTVGLLIVLENAAWSADCCRCSVVRARAGGAAGPPSFLLPFFFTGCS